MLKYSLMIYESEFEKSFAAPVVQIYQGSERIYWLYLQDG